MSHFREQRSQRAELLSSAVPMNITQGMPTRRSLGWNPAAAEEEPSILMEYSRTLLRRRRAVIGLCLLGGIIGWLSTVHRAPVYRARTSLEIQNLNENFMNMRAVDPTGAAGSYSAESYLQTQIKLLQSDSLLNRAERRMRATSSKEAMPPQDLLSTWRRKLSLAPPPTVPQEKVLAGVTQSVKVKPLGLTRLVEVSCDSPDAKQASDFCNTIANEFIAQSLEIRWETAQKTSDWLARQLADVRSKLEENEQKLQSFARASSLYFDQQKDSVAQEKLRQLQAELSRAEADRVAKQAQLEMSRGALPDTLPMVLDSGPWKEYQMRLSDLRRKKAETESTYTPEHPKVQRIEAEIAEVQLSIERERRNIVSRMNNEHDAAVQREKLLQKAYGSQETIVADITAKSAQYNMLRRDVESGRQLYETLLQRSKEAGFASAMRASTIRVVDPAKAPDQPVSPNRSLSTTLGLLFGGLIGGAFACLREQSDRRLRLPGDARVHLNTRELGVIPSAKVEGVVARPRLGAGLRRGLESEKSAELLTLNGLNKQPEMDRNRLELVAWYHRPSLMAESYRMVMSSLLFATDDSKRPGMLLITSPEVGEGKTTVVSNLGIALAETKRRTVLVDGDLRRPRLHQIFGVESRMGLRNVLLGEVDPRTCPLDTIAQQTQIPNLWIVSSGRGKESVSTLLHSVHMQALLDRLRMEFDVVLIDSPPMLHMADARLLGHLSDGVILVLRAGIATRDTAAEAQRLLEIDDTEVVGTVLNDFDPQRESMYRYYHSYYSYQKHA